ncbi:MAG: SpoIID/LytB domain-containing protein [Byssovorax sp.]
MSQTTSTAARIVLVGDSLAQGLGPVLTEIARRSPCAFHAVGKKSTRVHDWMGDSDLPAAIGAPPADLVLVCLGTNDMRTADPGGAGTEGGALVDKIVARGASVAWIGPPRMTFDTGAFRSGLASACGSRNVRIFDSQSLDLERAPDGIHLTPKGYRAWAESIAAWVPFAAYAAGGDAGPNAARDGEAAALVTLRAQLDAQWPSRSRAADGIAPSAAHHAANPKSDHEVGNAFDITNDPGNGPDLVALGTALLKDSRAHYVIFQGRIANPGKDGGAWRPYTGASPHEEHLHLSIYDSRRDDRTEWDLAGVGIPASPAVASAPVGPVPTISMPTSLVVEGFGRLALEDYVARVVTAELGASRQLQALEAQAMVARSYLVWMISNQGYGTPAKPVPNSAHFQVCARAATALCLQAASATRGGLVLHRGRLVLTSYVAGALWPAGASTGRNGHDPTKTEHGVTYNDGLLNAAVRPTPNAGPIVDNRGCLSQNGAVELGRRGVLWPAILRYFYGADLDFTCREPASAPPGQSPPRRPDAPRHKAPPSPPGAPSDEGPDTKDTGSLVIAALLTAYRVIT